MDRSDWPPPICTEEECAVIDRSRVTFTTQHKEPISEQCFHPIFGMLFVRAAIAAVAASY